MDSPLGQDSFRPVRVLLGFAGFSLLLLLLACAPTSEPQAKVEPGETAAVASPSVAEPMVETGNEVGDRIPDFTLDLADGTRVTSASLNEQGEPAFLFFFSTT